MKPTHSLTVSDIVKEILEQAPLADAGIVERRVSALVKAIIRQKTCERLAPSDANKRLVRISDAVRELDREIFDDNPRAHAARRVMAAEAGKAEFDELLKSLEEFASRQLFENVEFSPALQSGAEEYAERVAAAARALSTLLSEDSPAGRAVRRQVCSTATERLRARLQHLSRAAETSRVPTGKRRSTLFAPAEVARYAAKLSSGGRPTETAKLVAVWGAYLVLVELKLSLSHHPGGTLCRLSALCYEVATDERHADFSRTAKRFLKALRTRKVID